MRSADHHILAGKSGLSALGHASQPEIGQVDAAFGSQHDIGGFYVPVQHSLLVGVGQRIRHRLQNFQDAFRVKRFACQVSFESLPLNVAHHQVGHTLVFAEIIDGYDVGMLQFGHDPRLALETGQEVGVLFEGWVQHLDSHVAVQGWMVGFEDRGHAPLSQLLDDTIWSDVFSC